MTMLAERLKTPMFGEPIADGRRLVEPKSATRGKILVPLDGSSGARVALPVALALARQLGAEVDALYVSPWQIDPAEAAELLGISRLLGAEIAIRTTTGSPGEEILKAAADDRVELVVLATAGHSALEPGHLAPVAEEVAARAVQPVVFVPPRPINAPFAYRRLLVPIDGSRRTTRALRPAMQLARRLDASLDLLYVVTAQIHQHGRERSLAVPMYVDQNQEWRTWADWSIQSYRRQSRCGAALRARVFLGTGDPGMEIIRFAHEHREDAIVLVRGSHLEYGHATTLRTVLEKTHLPVIVVPAERERKPIAQVMGSE